MLTSQNRKDTGLSCKAVKQRELCSSFHRNAAINNNTNLRHVASTCYKTQGRNNIAKVVVVSSNATFLFSIPRRCLTSTIIWFISPPAFSQSIIYDRLVRAHKTFYNFIQTGAVAAAVGTFTRDEPLMFCR